MSSKKKKKKTLSFVYDFITFSLIIQNVDIRQRIGLRSGHSIFYNAITPLSPKYPITGNL